MDPIEFFINIGRDLNTPSGYLGLTALALFIIIAWIQRKDKPSEKTKDLNTLES